jgi:hypothetical protein
MFRTHDWNEESHTKSTKVAREVAPVQRRGCVRCHQVFRPYNKLTDERIALASTQSNFDYEHLEGKHGLMTHTEDRMTGLTKLTWIEKEALGVGDAQPLIG